MELTIRDRYGDSTMPDKFHDAALRWLNGPDDAGRSRQKQAGRWRWRTSTWRCSGRRWSPGMARRSASTPGKRPPCWRCSRPMAVRSAGNGSPSDRDINLARLGPPVVTRHGTPVSFDTRKATAVLALLPADGREISRERLAVRSGHQLGAARAAGGHPAWHAGQLRHQESDRRAGAAPGRWP